LTKENWKGWTLCERRPIKMGLLFCKEKKDLLFIPFSGF
jgi:hypothetical protein